MEEFFKVLISITATITSWFAGIITTPEAILLSFIMLDYFTSIISHFINSSISSSKGFKGFLKKFLMIIISITAILLDNLLGSNGWISNTVIYYLIANEGISILENIERGGVIVPKFLKDRFNKLNDEEGNSE